MQVTLTHGVILGPQTVEQKAKGILNCGKAGETVNIPEQAANALVALGMATAPQTKPSK